MKCSDCNSFKMCILNPDAKDDDPETFGCFKFSGNNNIKQDTITYTRGRWGRIIALILFWIVVIGIVGSIILFVVGLGYLPEPEALRYMIPGQIGLSVFLPIAFFGFVFWLLDKMEERKRRQSFETNDSKSDYNKTIKKP